MAGAGSLYEIRANRSQPDGATVKTPAQDTNRKQEEREHAEGMWSQMLAGLKTYVER